MKHLTKNLLTSIMVLTLLFFLTVDVFAQSVKNEINKDERRSMRNSVAVQKVKSRVDLGEMTKKRAANYVALKKAFLESNPNPSAAQKAEFIKKHYYIQPKDEKK